MKVAFQIEDLVRWTSGSLRRGRPDTLLRGVSIDSRGVEPGELFVAIVGPTHDGHRFCDAAAKRGAACLLVERGHDGAPDPVEDVATVAVADTTVALGALGAGHRADFTGPVIAITGSNGKTTTKEICAAILSQESPCHRTPGNLNNQFGLPLTLLGRDERDRAMVVELGMNHRGEIAELVELARPTVAVITNVGTAHIEYLGSRDEIAREKGDIIATLPPEATAVLNADDPAVMGQASRTAAKLLTFGIASDADVRAERISERDAGGCTFRLVTPAGSSDASVPGLGSTALLNSLAAAAAALAAGAKLESIVRGLARCEPVGGRLQLRQLARGIELIDDTYNANPQSTEAALRVLAQRRGANRKLAVLGEMGELGDASDRFHRDVGALAAELGIDFLIALGERASEMAAGALAAGMEPARVYVAPDHEDAAARTSALLAERDAVLVKGSRSMQMERVVEALVDEHAQAEPERDA